jgi:Zn-dependent M16 (insulinase) family peptidase
VYQQVIAPLPRLAPQHLQVLPLYTQVLTELGLGSNDYLHAQHRQSATVGAINAFSSMRGAIDNEQSVSAYLALSSKALLRNALEQSRLMRDTLETVRFDETARIRELISQQRARRDQSITGNGHGLVMAAACAGMSPLSQLNHELSGLAGIRKLRALDDSLKDGSTLSGFAGTLAELHEAVLAMPRQLLVVAEADKTAAVAGQAAQTWGSGPQAGDTAPFTLASCRERRAELWLTNTQVNFCARAYPTVPVQHPDAAALTVLGGFLRNGFLHRAIREQGGAYGGGASQDSGIAAFRFYSYRDPRLDETLQDFDRAVAWILDNTHEQRALEESVLGVIGSLDKPASPAGEAKQHFHNRLFGRSHEQREHFRQQVLAVSLEDLRRVAETYLRPELASTAVITSSGKLEATRALRENLGLSVQEL